MASTFRLKAQTIQAIEVTSPVTQVADIATLIGASAFIVDVIANTATFTIMASGDAISVTTGKVVSITSGVISVWDAIEFYETYEPEN